MTTLPGSIDSLLTRGCPVVAHNYRPPRPAIVLSNPAPYGDGDYSGISCVTDLDKGGVDVTLLALDLTDPAGMDRARAFLGERVGLDVSGGVTWTYTPARHEGVASWTLRDSRGRAWALCDYPADIEAQLGPPGVREGYAVVRNLPTDGATALALAVLACAR